MSEIQAIGVFSSTVLFVVVFFWLLTAFVSFPSETLFRQSALRSLLFRTSLKASGCLSFSREIQLGGSNLTPGPFVVVLGDCVQCIGSLPQCNLPGLFGFPKCAMSFEKCKSYKPRPFRPGILQLETDCY